MKRYINVAIDHGTTNSAIAVMEEEKPRVIKHGSSFFMPSAVYINRYNRIFIGEEAKKAMLASSKEEGEGYTSYKLRMGQDYKYPFKAAGRTLSAEELGGLVMSELLSVCKEEIKEDIIASVITVPAKFLQSACEGTRKAAELSGLRYFPLLQEPVAAGIAYGFNKIGSKNEKWIIVDLGGGTLDVCLIELTNEGIRVTEKGHEGNNRLGGNNFDRVLLEFIVGPDKKEEWERYRSLCKDYAPLKERYNFKKFPPDDTILGKLLIAVEQAKIKLSTRKKAYLELDNVLCKDDDGKDVIIDEIEITRDIYEKLIAHDVEKIVQCCDNLLKKNRLSTKDIERVILVGGPTKTPYIQERLGDYFNKELEKSIDPMTVVVKGAAIYASTIEIPSNIIESVSLSSSKKEIKAKLEYPRT